MFYVPKRNTGKSFERPAKILRGRQIFGNNLRAGGEAGGVSYVVRKWGMETFWETAFLDLWEQKMRKEVFCKAQPKTIG